MTKTEKKRMPEYTARQRAIYKAAIHAIHWIQEDAGPAGRALGTKAKPIKRARVLQVIQRLAGAYGGPYSKPVLPADFKDLHDRDMRKAISTGRKHGEWPCLLSNPGGRAKGGYYMAAGPEEIREAADNLRSYLIDQAWNLRGLRASEAHARGMPLFPAYEEPQP